MDVMTLLIGIVIGLIIGWLIEWFIDWRFWRRPDTEEAQAEAVEPDDLTRIEGIGPVIQGILNGVGIATFNALADNDARVVEAILQAADFKAPFEPSSWAEQARLAAKGDWDALQVLQDRLTAGREATDDSAETRA